MRYEGLEERTLFAVGGLGGLDLTASSALVTDGTDGVIGDLNPDESGFIASTTKTMTTLVALEMAAADDQLDLTDDVEISEHAVQIGSIGSGFGDFVSGQTFVLEDLLHVVMRQSDNAGAQAVAEHVARAIDGDDDSLGLESTFAGYMNDKAEELGMDSTHFTNPRGADTPGQHYSTATDMGKLLRYAMQNETFREIVKPRKHFVDATLPGGDEASKEYELNKRIIGKYPGSEGGKTGWTPLSKGVVIGRATILGRTVDAVVMGADSGYDAEDVCDVSIDSFDASDCLPSDEPFYDEWGKADVKVAKSEANKLFTFGFQERYGFQVDASEKTVTTATGIYDFGSDLFTVIGTDGDDQIEVNRGLTTITIAVNGVSESYPAEDIEAIAIDSGEGTDSVALAMTATAGNDEIEVTLEESTITIAVNGVSEAYPTDEIDSFVINGGGGADTLTLEGSGATLKIDGPYSGHLEDNGTGNSVLAFEQFEHILADDHGDTPATARRISVLKGFDANFDVEDTGYLGGPGDEDWFRVESGTGTLEAQLSSTGPSVDATLELWDLSDEDAPTFLTTVDADAGVLSESVEAGEYGLRVGGASHLGQYRIEASVPSPPATMRDMHPIPRVKEFWEAFPTRGFDPINPVIGEVMDSVDDAVHSKHHEFVWRPGGSEYLDSRTSQTGRTEVAVDLLVADKEFSEQLLANPRPTHDVLADRSINSLNEESVWD